jgi:hypothetical protein
VPAERIADNLAAINWTVLFALAAGTTMAVLLAAARTEATRGYLAFTAACAAGFGLLGFASDGGLPNAAASGAGFLAALRPAGLGLGTLATLVLTVALARGRRAVAVGVAALAAWLVAGLAVALDFGGSPMGAVLLAVQLGVLAAATGGAWAAMILGHWYLVTPRLPTGPLVLLARALLAVVALQAVLFVVWAALGAGPGGRPAFAILTGDWAMFVWLRLLVGLAFPLAVSWAALQTARSRSMESATGLLYIDLGTVAVGTILAAGLYFGAGLLV